MISLFGSNLLFEYLSFFNISILSQKLNLISIVNCDLILFNLNTLKISTNILYALKSTVFIKDLKIFGDILSNFTGVISINNRFLNITHSTFVNFTNIRGGAIYNENSYFILSFSNFSNNYGQNGGAIHTINSNVSFTKNIFDRNSANYGAAIYFYSQNLILDLKLEGNKFSFGKANFAGGAIYSIYSIPNSVVGNVLLNNSAKYGNDFATPPIALFLEENEQINKEVSNYLPSSHFSEMIFYLKDLYNNTLHLELNGKASLSLARKDMYEYMNITDESNKNNKLSGQVLSDYSSKGFIFKDISLSVRPNSSLLLKIDSNLINSFASGNFSYSFPHYIDFSNNYYYLVEIHSKECPLGIILN